MGSSHGARIGSRCAAPSDAVNTAAGISTWPGVAIPSVQDG